MSMAGGTLPGGASSLWGGGASGSPSFGTEAGRGFFYPALRKAGITLGPQRTPSPAQYQDALEEFNRLAGSLSCDRFFIYSMLNYVFPLTGSKTYTMGISPDPNAPADFPAPRPVAIETANIVMNPTGNNLRYPLALVTDLQWARIRLQDIPNTIPEVLYNDRAYPLSTLYLWGQPVTNAGLELFVWQTVPKVLAWTDLVAVPDGYEDALVLNLAVRLAPHFQRVVPDDVRQQARESLMRLESINAPQPVADTSALCSGYNNNRYNIYSDQFRR